MVINQNKIKVAIGRNVSARVDMCEAAVVFLVILINLTLDKATPYLTGTF